MVSGSFHNQIDIRKVMMCVAHGSNTFDKTPLLSTGAVLELGIDHKESLRELMG